MAATEKERRYDRQLRSVVYPSPPVFLYLACPELPPWPRALQLVLA
jgi:hypothetical protein